MQKIFHPIFIKAFHAASNSIQKPIKRSDFFILALLLSLTACCGDSPKKNVVEQPKPYVKKDATIPTPPGNDRWTPLK